MTGRVCRAVATSIWGSAMRSNVSRSGDVKRAGNETESASDRCARQWSTWYRRRWVTKAGSWGRWVRGRNLWKAISSHPPSCTCRQAGLGPSNAPLASLALSGRWGRRLDRPPRRGVASDSEIRRTTSFIWTPASCSLALRSSGAPAASTHTQPPISAMPPCATSQRPQTA